MSNLDNTVKEQRFRYPDASITGFGRMLSVVSSGRAVWVSAQMEREGRDTIVVKKREGAHVRCLVLDTEAHCHRPCLTPNPTGGVCVAWNQVSDDGTWRVQAADLTPAADTFPPPQTVAASERLCLPPALTQFRGETWIAWSGVSGGNARIHVARERAGVWEHAGAMSAPGHDSFRPVFSGGEHRLLLAWDQYRNGSYDIAYTTFDGSAWASVQHLATEGERWFCPRAAATDSGAIYLCWVVLQEVSDERGIADHAAFAMVGEYRDGAVRTVIDETSPDDPRAIADLREGLLAAEVYKGYLGWRRNPMLSVDGDGALWCLWEVRVEEERTAVRGHLAGRKLMPDGHWTAPRFVANSGYAYAAAPRVSERGLPVGFLRFAEDDMNLLDVELVEFGAPQPYRNDRTKWSRWCARRVEPLHKPQNPTHVDGTAYSLFWADTHCHSNMSADVEGETDEIIHFARDIAQLDAVCVVDNDYYPNKSLTPAEWHVHQELCRHYTSDGRFVVFPGYEFTYHRSDLTPDFNHRTVIYPQPGGMLRRRIDAGTRTDRELLAALGESEALCFPHHCSYELLDEGRERNVEICSSWRVCMEETDFTMSQLKAGKRFGFLGCSDAHRANPGLGGALTGVYAEALTPQALFDAYRQRRTVATQGFGIYIDFRVAGCFIGSETSLDSAPVSIDVYVLAPRPIVAADVVRDGVLLTRWTPGKQEFATSVQDDAVEPGEHVYFLRVRLEGEASFNTDSDREALHPFTLDSRYPHNLARARGVFAWTSPVWVDVG